MSPKSIKKFTDFSHSILYGISRFLGYTAIFMIAMILMLYLALSIWLGNIRDHANEARLAQSEQYDRQRFPSLTQPIFFYQRMHVGDSGNWVVVYPLDEHTKKQFLLRLQHQENQNESTQIECIKLTIKKRWKSWHSNIHYVQPAEWLRAHNDYKAHDSFIVYGSEKPIKTVEQACSQQNFLKLNDAENYAHDYWAISESQALLFSVYEIR